jgi:predicted nucleic acid-binding protein
MLILDAGPIYAAAATRDNNHRRCVELIVAATRPLLVPELVVTEVSYLLADRIGPHAEVAFARSVAAGEIAVEPVLDHEWDRITELMEQYLDLPLGIVDASVVTLAERHDATEIATLDRRHFTVVRPRHVASFTLLP